MPVGLRAAPGFPLANPGVFRYATHGIGSGRCPLDVGRTGGLSPASPKQERPEGGVNASTTGIGTKIAFGAGWMLLARFGVRSIGFISTIILARILVPEDFGLVALAMVVVAGLEAMSELSFHVYLISHQDTERRHYDTVWTLSILRGVLIASLLWVSAPYAADFFEDQRISAIVQVIALAPLLRGFENVGIVDFQKEFQFSRDFSLTIRMKMISFVVTILMALLLENYWALVAGIVVGRAGGLILSFLMHPFRPRWSLAAVREIFGYSSWLLATSMIMFLRNRSDHLILAKLLGAGPLGVYTVAFDIAELAGTEVLAPIRRAFLPGFSRLAEDRLGLTRLYVDSTAIVALLMCPVAIGLGLTADPLVRVLLGSNWLDAIPLIEIFSLYAFVNIWETNTTPVFLALKRPSVITWIGVGTTAVLLPLLWLGASTWGTAGAAVAMVGVVIVNLVARVALLAVWLKLPASLFVARTWRILAALAVMVAAVLAVQSSLPPATDVLSAFLNLLIQVGVGAAAYTGSVGAFWWISGQPDGAEAQIISFCRQSLRGWGRPAPEGQHP